MLLLFDVEEADESDVDEVELMLSFRLMEADEFAIILRRFEVSVSEETKEAANELVVEEADELFGAEAADMVEPTEAVLPVSSLLFFGLVAFVVSS